MVEVDKVEDLEFKWGKQKAIGGKKKDVKFYESFMYDGVNYVLYDCVYLFKEGEPEPYIGKLIKIWETPDNRKKVKVLWFFRPCEILHYLGVEDTAENELFLASGDGVGLANVNPLEAIAGKCNVVCISKDSRNPQPSDEELQAADFIFYRAFDVGHLKILNKIEEKIAGIEVKFIFNRVDLQKPTVVPKLDSDKKEVSGNVVASDVTGVPSKQNPSKDTLGKESTDSKASLGKESADSKTSLVKQKISLREKPASSVRIELDEMAKSNNRVENISNDKTKSGSKAKENIDLKASPVEQNFLLRQQPTSDIGVELGDISKTNDGKENISSDKTALRSKADSVKGEGKFGKVPIRPVEVEEKVKSAKGSGDLDNRPSKKVKFDSSVKVDNGPSKKETFDTSVKVVDGKNKKIVEKFSIDADGNDPKASASVTAEDKSRLKRANDSHGAEKGPSKRLKPDEKTKLSNGKLPKAFPRQSPDEDKKIDHQVIEVTRRPDVDKSKWFKGLWEDKMKNAREKGTLVLLQNLDPSYTSAEVEDIVWHGFKEYCTAKMIQRTLISVSHSGQAFVIFKTREAAEMVVRKLEERCLLLSNGRPLVGSIANPCFPEKKQTFFGHCAINKLRHQMQREMKEAVSTSHCSQPNTMEYDMAMEWCLLQERSDLAREKLFKQQEEKLRKLEARLKFK